MQQVSWHNENKFSITYSLANQTLRGIFTKNKQQQEKTKNKKCN